MRTRIQTVDGSASLACSFRSGAVIYVLDTSYGRHNLEGLSQLWACFDSHQAFPRGLNGCAAAESSYVKTRTERHQRPPQSPRNESVSAWNSTRRENNSFRASRSTGSVFGTHGLLVRVADSQCAEMRKAAARRSVGGYPGGNTQLFRLETCASCATSL
jgi:hypothetical protein